MAHDWAEQDRREQEALSAHHHAVTRHFDRSVTAGFLDEMEAWLASWFEAPAGYDTEHLVAATTDRDMVRVARCMRWAVDHIRQRDPDIASQQPVDTGSAMP